MKACAVHIIIKNKGFEIVGGSQEKRPFSNGLFSIQSEGLVWNHPQGVWNPSQSDGMASRAACIFLRIDSIQHFVMIPYKASLDFIPQQVADSIYGFAVIVAHRANERQQFCTLTQKSLISGGFSCF